MNKRYWLVGGIIVALLYIIWAIYWFWYSASCAGMFCSIGGLLGLLPIIILGDRLPGSSDPHVEGLIVAVIVILNTTFFFVVGGLIGALIGRLRDKIQLRRSTSPS